MVREASFKVTVSPCGPVRRIVTACVDQDVAVADELAGLAALAPQPARNTTLSRRSSSMRSRFSPVMPGVFASS